MLLSKMTDTIFCCVVLLELLKDCLASKCMREQEFVLWLSRWNRVFHWLYRLFIAAIHFNHKKSNQKPRILDITYPKFKKGEPTVRKRPEKADFGKHSDITILVDTPQNKCVVLIILLCNNKISRLLQTFYIRLNDCVWQISRLWDIPIWKWQNYHFHKISK